jgi:dipicolinate synthase subunit A
MLLRYDFAVVGGDRRQLCLAELLRGSGYAVAAAGFGGLADCVPLEDMRFARFIMLPLPLESAEGALSAPLSETPISVSETAELVREGQKIFCGKASESAEAAFRARGADVVDYFRSEELAVKNAAITAEGAIYAAMRERQSALLGARCVVAGYGRIGKQLARRLAALGAEVTVAARKSSDRALAELDGCASTPFERLCGALSKADIVFNTVPARVFGECEIAALPAKCLFIELASPPYGADMDELKARAAAIREPSLPGRYAPESAARAVFDTVCHIMEERGWSV